MKMTYQSPISEIAMQLALLSSCSSEWQAGARVVITALLDIRFRLGVEVGDLVLEERLRALHEEGEVEIDTPHERYGRYNVRLAEQKG